MSQVSSKIYCFNPSLEIESNIRDKTIYHYSSPEAMISILTSGAIRFTDCQFLNDRTEYNHILDPLKSAIDQVEPTLYNQRIADFIHQGLGKNYQSEKTVFTKGVDGKLYFESSFSRYYVFCASLSPDSLSMWNYYVKNGSYQGYSIGISVNRIVETLPSLSVDSIMFGEVIYDDKQKVSLLVDLIESADDELELAKKGLKHDADYEFELEVVEDEVMSELIKKLDYYRLFFKNSAFTDEKEFRIAIVLPQTETLFDTDDIVCRFTAKHGVITPHFDLSIPKSSIKRIYLSPMLERDLAVQGLRRLLYKYKYSSKIEVRYSSIPIRY